MINAGLLSHIECNERDWEAVAYLCDSTKIKLGYCGHSLDLTSDNLALNPYGVAPLSLRIKVTTPVFGKFSVRVIGQDGLSSDMIGDFDNYTREHVLDVIGLYPEYKNQIELTFKSKGGIIRCIDTVTVTTPKIDFDLPNIEVVKQYDVAVASTVFLVNSLTSNIPYMIDSFGKVRWYSNGFSEWQKFGLQRLPNGNMLYGKAGYGQGGFVEYTMMGNLVKEFTVYPEYENIHHDVCVLPNGNLIATVNKTGISTIHDILIEVERVSGQVLNVWDFRDILPVDRYTFRKITDEPCWLHISGVQYIEESQSRLLVSGALKYDLNYTDSLNNFVFPNTNFVSTRIIEVEGKNNVRFEMLFKSQKMDMIFRMQKMKLYN